MKAKYFIALLAAIIFSMAMVSSARASVKDHQIVASAKDTYVFKTFLKGDDIKIKSKNGDVTLTGVVEGPGSKLLAEITVQGLPGVKSVDNRLTVKDADPSANSDAWLKEKVITTLRLHRSMDDSEIQVSVKDGIVTLTGVAANRATKDLATTYTEDVDGVKSVKNEMAVDSSWKATYNRASDYVDDSSITAQVKYALLTHRSTSALDTHVETTDGVVTLTGTAKNQAERTLATLLANDIFGVKAVKNRMTIE